MTGTACPFPIMQQQLNTILAALRFYQQQGQGTPSNRSDEIHDIATNGDCDISLDDSGIDELCEALNFGEILLSSPFTGQELTTLLEVARLAMADADMFTDACEAMDVSDSAMAELRDKLQAIMDSDVPLFGKVAG